MESGGTSIKTIHGILREEEIRRQEEREGITITIDYANIIRYGPQQNAPLTIFLDS